MSIYGDLLSAFPELIKQYQIFTMTPKAGGGYTDRSNLFKKRGAFIKGAKSRMSIFGEARVPNEAGIFICFERNAAETMKHGMYFEDDDQIFVITDDQVYKREAGFGAYGCQLVQGVTDRQVENMEVEQSTISDYPI